MSMYQDKNLWHKLDSNPMAFGDCANTLPLSYRANRSTHRTFHLKPILVTSRPFLLVLGCLQLLKLRKAILPLSYITRLQVLVAGQTDLPISTVCMTFQLDGRSKRLTNIHSMHDFPIGWQVKKTYQYPQSA